MNSGESVPRLTPVNLWTSSALHALALPQEYITGPLWSQRVWGNMGAGCQRMALRSRFSWVQASSPPLSLEACKSSGVSVW
jgi:hypothetical protein